MGTIASRLGSFDWGEQKFVALSDHYQEGLRNAAAKLHKGRAVEGRKKRDTILGRDSSLISIRPERENDEESDIEDSPERMGYPSRKQASGSPLTSSMSKPKELIPGQTDVRDINYNFANQGDGLSTETPFYPESWPSRELVQQYLSMCNSMPTTLILARFAPRNTQDFMEIFYSSNKHTHEKLFKCSGKLDTLIQSKEGFEMGSTKEQQIEYFLRIFKSCINLLHGQVWWNGFSLILDQISLKNRLKVTAFEVEPSQLLFELVNMKDLEVLRSNHKVELRGQPEGVSEEEMKCFRIRGNDVKEVKVSKLRGNLVTVHIPENTEAAAEF